MNQIIPASAHAAALMPRDMNSAMQLANMMCSAKLVPPHLQKSPGDCLLIIEQANRWGMSPFAVAQCTSVIHGRLMFQGQLVSAALHTSGILASRLSYEFSGEGESRSVRCVGTLKGESKPRDIVVRYSDAKTSNEIWKKQPDQQLVYFATRAWARRHAPEVMLGVYSPEDFPAGDGIAVEEFSGTTIEAQTTGEAIEDSLPEHSAPPDDALVERMTAALAKAPDRKTIDKIALHPEAIRLADRISVAYDAAIARIGILAPDDADPFADADAAHKPEDAT